MLESEIDLGSRCFATLDRQGRSSAKRDWLVNELRSNAYANIDEVGH
jgi:hypothetical protein